tara:strand:- start:3850 stop:4371 length:522 start_codon:yes stop_codon:yes gene_type:complete
MLPNFNNIALRRNDIPGSTGAARFPLSGVSELGNIPLGVGLPSSGVTPTTSGGTLVHTFSADTNAIEEVYLYSSNYDASSDFDITLSFGLGTDAVGVPQISTTSIITIPIKAATGLNLILPGVPCRTANTAAPLSLYACTTSTGKLNVFGYVLRYYPINPDEDLVDRAGYSGV